MGRKWEVVAWTSEWHLMYEIMSKELQHIFQKEIIEIHHVGSTSVPSIGYAKPIIDILIIVENIENVSLYDGLMMGRGYRVRGENGIPGRRYFTKGENPRTHHIHIFENKNPRILTSLDLKSYLMEYPLEAAKYGLHKLKLLESYPHELYQQEKEKYTDILVMKALKWGKANRTADW
ncbi:GrpB family protein [Paenibacillus prosopidis]|uniref:GrpB-like predicted nucleotidyltransferase (UPF0157 family) n=1 Tax=Paenibacillus prosopidis TaxID=630520 RepID=A0A368WBA8_9BACL|nr:GrpB family protein [Paenibacillus prosopidis]RCW50363.1 GrpB-like predicted nucleotidyltransferase (UPF0157 family) [Paenibacillus prosopidis]